MRSIESAAAGYLIVHAFYFIEFKLDLIIKLRAIILIYKKYGNTYGERDGR
jgi:hypothetical protein